MYVLPFQVYDVQAETVSVELLGELMVKIKVTTESHPTALVPVQLYSPPTVYVVPLKVKLLQADCVTVLVLEALMVKFNVAVESQPTALVVVNVFAPLVV